MAKLERPSIQTELYFFPSLCSIFMQLVTNLARLAGLLNSKLRMKEPKKLSTLDKTKSATVASLKAALIRLPVLVSSKTRRRYTLDTNPCDKQIGCVILEKQEDRGNRLFAYRSQTLNDQEEKLATKYRDCLAVV